MNIQIDNNRYDLKEGDILHGFELVRIRQPEELHGCLYEFVHGKTGARLVWLANGEENKVFSITFKTLPKNDTGVFHILEHCVLNGSENYQSKGLFIELMKSSLQTYMNASTYTDHTSFPVASRNDKDFMNLVKVYLDSTLCPLVLRQPHIFEQEGWHYELDQDTGSLLANGVVYNEMKGDFSSPDTLLYNGIARLLYPDTTYGFVSGGDPAHIPELTYEELVETYKECYHPSNSYVYLDGNLDLSAVLSLIDRYFDRYDIQPAKSFASQAPAPYQEVCEEYTSVDEDDGAYLMMGQLLPEQMKRVDIAALALLSGYLAGSNEAPLKKVILEKQLAYDAMFFVDDNAIQPYAGVSLRYMDASRKEEAVATVKEVLGRIASEGIPEEELLAEIDHLEYMVKDVEEPTGLGRHEGAVSAWIYEGDPMKGLLYEETFAALRAYTKTGRYAELLKTITFEGDGCGTYVLLPSMDKAEEDYRKERAYFDEIYANMTEDQRQEVVEKVQSLEMWQNEPDTPEIVAKIPRLSIGDVQVGGIEDFRTGEMPKKNLFHQEKTQGIIHYTLYFSTADCTMEEARILSFLTNVFTMLPTKKRPLSLLDQVTKQKIGVLDFNVSAFSHEENVRYCMPYFIVNFSVLEKNEQEAYEIVADLLRNTDFISQESQEMMWNILVQCQESLFESIQMEGSHYASIRANSHLMAVTAYTEEVAGIEFYRYIKSLGDQFEEDMDAFAKQAEELTRKVFTRDKLTLSIVAPEMGKRAEKLMEQFGIAGDAEAGSVETGNMATSEGVESVEEKRGYSYIEMDLDGQNRKEFITIPSTVSYAASSALLPEIRKSYHGECEVLANILDFDYLWNEIRVQGGAYGCGTSISSNGSRNASTYRDPNPFRSLEVFLHQKEFLEEFLDSDINLEPYIIGAYATTDPLVHVRQKADREDQDYFLGFRPEDRARFQQELLATTKEKLQQLIPILIPEEKTYASCVIGNSEVLENLGEEEKKNWRISAL